MFWFPLASWASVEFDAHQPFCRALYRTGSTGNQDEMARTTLYEAANVLLSRITRFSKLKRWGVDVAKRRGVFSTNPDIPNHTIRAPAVAVEAANVSLCARSTAMNERFATCRLRI